MRFEEERNEGEGCVDEYEDIELENDSPIVGVLVKSSEP